MSKLGAMIILLLIAFFSGPLEAGEVTGAGRQVENILEANNYTKQKLLAMGLEVKLGEVTGAGRVHVDDIRMLVTKKGLFKTNQLHHIKFRDPSTGKFVSEVKSFDFPDIQLNKSKILAFIVEK